ncbi:Uncharacterised protein [Mycobacteroides abscessus subsp. abscessus]|nr:Uncharacterised protein [Mycobacteroides abscessus subsp. abscessus]
MCISQFICVLIRPAIGKVKSTLSTQCIPCVFCTCCRVSVTTCHGQVSCTIVVRIT